VELAREEAGHVPEVSYGTHFFLDLVEGLIIYLPEYPHDPAAGFNADFFEQSPNALPSLLPDAAAYEPWMRLIHVPAATSGSHVEVVANPETQAAVCYLNPASDPSDGRGNPPAIRRPSDASA